VGVVGYTLGGGMGWLARKYGLSADNVIYFEVVTADGRLIRVSQTENADLFWALRGGGGAFGIVTGMEIKLFPVTTVYGGNLYYPAEMAKEVIIRYREWIKDAPDELTSSFAIFNYPPIPQIPEPIRGKSFIQVRGLWSGDVEKGKELLKFWREWQAPAMDAWVEMPFAAAATVSNDPEAPTPGLTTSAWIRELSDEAIDTLIKYAVSVNGSSPLVVAEVRHAGGAISRVDPHSAAYGNRDAQHVLEMIAITPTPEAQHGFHHYANEVRKALAPALTGGVYMNFLEGHESRERVKQGFLPENFQRLTEIKAKYDPENYFSYGFNIPPAGKE
jgi:FAD/FMN-containing dehydrogenase